MRLPFGLTLSSDEKLKTFIQTEVEKSARGIVAVIGDGETEKREGAEHDDDNSLLFQLYEETTWVRAVVDVITRAIIARGYTIEKTLPNADVRDMRTVLEFLESCNPTDTLEELLEDVIRDLLVVGNGYQELVRENGVLTELWSLDPQYTKIKHDIHGRVTGYVNEVDGHDPVHFSLTDVMHFRLASRGSKPYGLSKLVALAGSMTLDANARKYNTAFFKRGAKVRGIIVMKNATPDQVKRNRMYLSEIAKKPEHARGDLLFEGDVDYKPIGTKPQEMDFLNLLKFIRDEVLAVYGCPPSKVALIETGNIGSGSGQSQDQTFYEETIVPLQRKIGARITKSIIRGGLGIRGWDFKFIQRTVNEKEKAEVHKIYSDTGVLTTEEIRSDLKRPSRGTESQKSLGRDETVIYDAPRILALERELESAIAAHYIELRGRVVGKVAAMDRTKIESLSASLRNVPLETRYTHKQFGSYEFRAYRFPVLRKAADGDDDLEDIDDSIDDLLDPEILAVKMDNHLLPIATAAGIFALGKLRKEFPNLKYVPSEELKAAIHTYTRDLSRYLSNGLSQEVRMALLEGIQSGEEMRQIIKRVEAVMENPVKIAVKPHVDAAGNILRAGHMRTLSVRERAKLIARTETTRFSNAGALDAYRQTDRVKRVEFLIAETACEECAPYAGRILSLDEAEGIIPVHHSCRCAWTPLLD